MLTSLRLWLTIVTLLAATLAFACSGGDDNGDDGDGDQPTATETVADDGDNGGGTPDGDGTSDGDGSSDGDGGNGGGAAFSDVPIPSGADEKESGSFEGSVPFPIPGSDVDADAFTNLEFREYELDDSPTSVLDFYKDELDGWDEIATFSGGDGAFGVWTRGSDTALWIGASVEGGPTTLVVILGTSD